MGKSTQAGVRGFAGKQPRLGRGAFIDPMAVVIGDVELGDDVSVWPAAVVRGDIHRIRIGARTSVQDGSVLHVTHAGPFNPEGWPLLIGEGVIIGHHATLHGCQIGDRVLVGMGAIVMDGAIIGNEVIIAAGALVTPGKHLASGFLYGGSPARQMRALTAGEREYFGYSADHYVRLKDRHMAEQQAAQAR